MLLLDAKGFLDGFKELLPLSRRDVSGCLKEFLFIFSLRRFKDSMLIVVLTEIRLGREEDLRELVRFFPDSLCINLIIYI